jgi:hypothetical protein
MYTASQWRMLMAKYVTYRQFDISNIEDMQQFIADNDDLMYRTFLRMRRDQVLPEHFKLQDMEIGLYDAVYDWTKRQ